ncbi:hypothetical protein KIH87_14040 [Paraneptunicella aestuarii]|uniref:hypothetical protein n=1 Tax=Paraneptunicella aestuarii TaxID=2831148 RepID=UPI001E5BB441|nr:hypothetical protein [Paraneptunicella aestuarii]UAA37813.1 hypothetical protein KIH87_14040 [Paraneptunicella aestuarii]
MKFNVKSALPSAAVAMLAISTVAKVDKALSFNDMDKWDVPTHTKASPELDNAYSANDSFGACDSSSSSDSFGACDSAGSGDSFGASAFAPCDPQTGMDSYGTCGGGTVQHAVFIIERDFISDNNFSGEYVTDTLCVKYDRDQIIAQALGDQNRTYLATGKYNATNVISMTLVSDPNVKGDLMANMYFYGPYWDGYWRGTWNNRNGEGDVQAQVLNGNWAYYSHGCSYVFGHH